ncbi:hypothetical protein [Herbaspirillum huttiense]|uniref:Uncharacterized protein n=2 Tax=Herbaspirillum huttiense TaxID=863372 RepID=A0AAJ2LW27_9BURK|nr:hypothetical protein [Herbaspirillum huttiense]MDR9837646.1 hypothetical protein [Herbaspirillum huttiense]
MILDAKEAAAQAFERALKDGVTLLPSALRQLLDALQTDAEHQPDLNEMADGLRIEFPYVEALQRGYADNDELHEVWVHAIRELLNRIRNWKQDDQKNSVEVLRALVTAAFVLDVQLKGLTQVATAIVTEPVRTGLKTLLLQYTFREIAPGRRYQKAHDDARENARTGRFEKILPRFHHFFFRGGGDISSAIRLLYESSPSTLAQVIEEKDDINFSGVVQDALGPQALRFALGVQNVGFKFACIATFCHENREVIPTGFDAPLGELLHQISQSSDAVWDSWMKAFFKHPGSYLPLEKALAQQLHTMDERHWVSLLNAPSLRYARKSAAPFTQLMLDFRAVAGDDGLERMCHLAYEIWNKWDYRDKDTQSVMFSPEPCALDFLVAGYYACQTPETLKSEESHLQQAINSIEEQWFESASSLTDQRNRLLSRIRLVRHGIAFKNGCQEALPPETVTEPHPYFEARFPYSFIGS